MEGSGPSPGYRYSAAPPRSMDRYDDFMAARSPLGGGKVGRGPRAEYFARYGNEGINVEEELEMETAGTGGAKHERRHENTTTTTMTKTTKRVTVNSDAEIIAEEFEGRRVVDVGGKISNIRALFDSGGASRAEPPSRETGEALRANVTPRERSVGKKEKSGKFMMSMSTTSETVGTKTGGVGTVKITEQQRRTTGEVTTTATTAGEAAKQTLHPAEQRRRERWAEEERRRQLVAQAKARAQVEGGGFARRAVANMAGKSLTVVKRALAPLGAGGVKNKEKNAGDGSKQSPLYAVWAIVQAYAIVALVCTVYNSVFGGPSHSKVPDEVQVRMTTSLVGPIPKSFF